MRTVRKWITLLTVLTLICMATMAMTISAVAEETTPNPDNQALPEGGQIQSAPDTQSPTQSAPDTTAPTASPTTSDPAAPSDPAVTSDPVVYNMGIIEALVWDDTIIPNNSCDIEELIDGITVNLYRLESDGSWTLIGSKVTGSGGYGPLGYSLTPFPHGWVGWKELPVKWAEETVYKLVMVQDKTYIPLNGTERIAKLSAPLNYWMYYYPMAPDPNFSSFQIKATTATISGYVWHDANANQSREWFETPLSGWTIVLTKNGRRVATTQTNAYGYYQFRGLSPGTYYVWEAERKGWKQVCPYYKPLTWPPCGCEKGYYRVVAKDGEYHMNCNFGNLKMDSDLAKLVYALWFLGLIQSWL